LYAVLDSSSFTDNKGKVDKRAAFDPFTDQEKYSAKYHKRKRTVPELRGRNYGRDGYDLACLHLDWVIVLRAHFAALKYFPHELWSTLDPKREHPLWKTVEPESGTTARLRKRKRALLLEDEDDVPESQTAVAGAAAASGLAASQSDNDSDSDALVTSGRRKQRDLTRPRRGNPTTNAAKQKQGLDAEDDYPDVEPNENDDDGAGGGDDEPVDSEFSESDDGDGDDYNAENYFDPGEGDDDDGGGGGGGDDDGGYY